MSKSAFSSQLDHFKKKYSSILFFRSYIRLNVAMMLSTPVCGVAMRNEATAPFDAPSLRSDMAVGITPHEHSGSGMPNKAVLMTLRNDFLARNFV